MDNALQPVFDFRPVYSDPLNSLDPFIPEVWAQESLIMLENQLVVSNLIHRNFDNEIASYGDVVNTRRPAHFVAKRKADRDDVTVQAASATNVPVNLNMWPHVSFVIGDGEQSKGFVNLRDTYLTPAIYAMANTIDQTIMGQMYSYLANCVGQLGTDPTRSTLTSLKATMSNNQVPAMGRSLVVNPDAEAALLNVENLVNANTKGDDGSALREGHLGRILGTDIYMSQNAPSIATGNTTVSGAVNLGAGYVVGTTVIVIDGHSEDLTAGSWCTIAGDMTPQKITAVSGSPTTSITISPGLRNAVVDDAVVTIYTPGAVNLVAGYDQYYSKEMVIDGFSVAPKDGQLVSLGTGSHIVYNYSALPTATTTALLLNRDLQADAANDTVVGIGPSGGYNFAFHHDCLGLITRPVQSPDPGTGAKSYVAQANGLGLRVTITYEGRSQGHLVTIDVLAGVAVFNADLGCVLLS